MPCPGNPLGALVVKKDKEQCIAHGKEGSFELKPKETAYFLMNDVKTDTDDLYEDNSGSIIVELSME